jgi:hypothetical protein
MSRIILVCMVMEGYHVFSSSSVVLIWVEKLMYFLFIQYDLAGPPRKN